MARDIEHLGRLPTHCRPMDDRILRHEVDVVLGRGPDQVPKLREDQSERASTVFIHNPLFLPGNKERTDHREHYLFSSTGE